MTTFITGTLQDMNEGVMRVVDTQCLKDSILDYLDYVGGIPPALSVHEDDQSILGLRVPSGFVRWYNLFPDQGEDEVFEFSRLRAKDTPWPILAPRAVKVHRIYRGRHGCFNLDEHKGIVAQNE